MRVKFQGVMSELPLVIRPHNQKEAPEDSFELILG